MRAFVGGAGKSRTIVAVKFDDGRSALLECKHKEANALVGAAFSKHAVPTKEREVNKFLTLAVFLFLLIVFARAFLS